MKKNFFLKLCINPAGMLLLTLFMSFLAWIFPDFGIISKGIVISGLNWSKLDGFVFLLIWYFFIIVCSYTGFWLGQKINFNSETFQKYAALNDFYPYLLLSLISMVSVAYVLFFLVNKIGLYEIINVFTQHNANLLKKTIYSDYTIGMLSLRYTVILAGAITLFRIYNRQYNIILNFFNIVSLFFIASISFRLAIIIAVLFFIGLAVFNNKTDKKFFDNIFKKILFVLFVLLILFIFNYSRNCNYYHNLGQGFLTGGLSQIFAYLAAPFQGALYAGTHIFSLQGISWDAILMSANIKPEFTANSSFLSLLQEYGIYALPVACISLFLAAFIMGALINQGRNYLGLIYMTLLYCFADFWRIFMFNKGIIFVLIFISLFIVFICRFVPKEYMVYVLRGKIEE